MDSGITYPTWEQVGIPSLLVGFIRRLRPGKVVDYLVTNRIFRFHIRPQYVYQCQSCGNTKRVSRNWEDYSVCENCESGMVSSSANWRMGKDAMKSYSDGSHCNAVVQQMAEIYGTYFRDYPPENFLDCDWIVDRDALKLPKESEHAYGQHQPDDDFIPPQMPLFAAQFCCGDRVVHNSQDFAIVLAALLCPFLWDDRFDWKHKVLRDQGKSTHIAPLLNMWCKMEHPDKESSRMPRTRMHPSQLISGDNFRNQEIPDGVVEALQEPPAGDVADWFGGQNG